MKKLLLSVLLLAVSAVFLFPHKTFAYSYSVTPYYFCYIDEGDTYEWLDHMCADPSKLFSMRLEFDQPQQMSTFHFNHSDGCEMQYYAGTSDCGGYGSEWSEYACFSTGDRHCTMSDLTYTGHNHDGDLLSFPYTEPVVPKNFSNSLVGSALNSSITSAGTGATHAMGAVAGVGIGFLATATMVFKGLSWFKGIAGLRK
jgi:hypothetical protein